ncbi:unnamed protein product, partial [Rotaria sp. Silwood2]
LRKRFELFVYYKELCNVYNELNDRLVQGEIFELQAKNKLVGYDEAQTIDKNNCKAFEYGLPPTVNWSI